MLDLNEIEERHEYDENLSIREIRDKVERMRLILAVERWREIAKALYEALKEVEWIRIPAPDGMGYEACEWCHAEKHEGHLDNCSVGNAIARYEEESDESS